MTTTPPGGAGRLTDDEIADAVRRMNNLSVWCSDRDLDMRMPPGTIDPAAAASLLSRLLAEKKAAEADYEASLASIKASVRAIDVALNGDGAARQASACDLIDDARRVSASVVSLTKQFDTAEAQVTALRAALEEIGRNADGPGTVSRMVAEALSSPSPGTGEAEPPHVDSVLLAVDDLRVDGEKWFGLEYRPAFKWALANGLVDRSPLFVVTPAGAARLPLPSPDQEKTAPYEHSEHDNG
jgi:hypothetical protein